MYITDTSQNNIETSSSSPPAIIVTAPSREDIYASPSTMTIADAIKERRPTSTPIFVGRKPITSNKTWFWWNCIICKITRKSETLPFYWRKIPLWWWRTTQWVVLLSVDPRWHPGGSQQVTPRWHQDAHVINLVPAYLWMYYLCWWFMLAYYANYI